MHWYYWFLIYYGINFFSAIYFALFGDFVELFSGSTWERILGPIIMGFIFWPMYIWIMHFKLGKETLEREELINSAKDFLKEIKK